MILPPFDRRALPPEISIGEWRASDGWAMRRFDWKPEGRPRGSILFQAGRGDFIEKYIEAHAHFQRRGWHVTGFDWRGQGGSGRTVADPLTNHLDSLDPLLDDLDAFAGEWRAATPGPHVLIGHSMGGNIMLRLIAERNARADAAVLVSPMLGLNTGRLPSRVAGAVIRLACLAGLSRHAAWKDGERPGRVGPSRQSNLTGSLERYQDEHWWKANRPELALGAPSWGWLAAANASIAAIERPGLLEAIRMPILILGATHDRLVSAEAIRHAAHRIPCAKLVMTDQGAHELLREADPLRLALLGEIDAFLAERAPAA